MNDSITGSRMNPFAIPKIMIPNQALKNTIKTYDLLGLRVIMAKNVEKPPWKILEPI
jgi:hypothetical protein